MIHSFDAGSPEQNFFREFTPWTPWSNRATLDDGHGYKVQKYAGVYLLAHFSGVPPTGPADPLANEILYVGEAGRLKERWVQFENSAYLGLRGHSGGHHYRHTFGSKHWPRLFLAALPVWFGNATQAQSSEDWTQAFRLHAERRIIWELTVKRGGTHELLNRK